MTRGQTGFTLISMKCVIKALTKKESKIAEIAFVKEKMCAAQMMGTKQVYMQPATPINTIAVMSIVLQCIPGNQWYLQSIINKGHKTTSSLLPIVYFISNL